MDWRFRFSMKFPLRYSIPRFFQNNWKWYWWFGGWFGGFKMVVSQWSADHHHQEISQFLTYKGIFPVNHEFNRRMDQRFRFSMKFYIRYSKLRIFHDDYDDVSSSFYSFKVILERSDEWIQIITIT
jgi:hypothetical protein